MIVDAHMHIAEKLVGIPGYPAGGYAADVLREKMEAEGVGCAWALTSDGLHGDTRKWNDWLLDATRPHRDFFVPFCTVDPKKSDEAVDELDYYLRERSMRGLKLHNWLQGVSTTVPAMDDLLDVCAQFGVPVIFHDGTPPYCTPLQFARLAENHPKTTVILGHMGLKDMWPDALRAAKRLDNIVLCFCACVLVALRCAVDKVGAERILFGSDCGSVGSEKLLRERIAAVRSLEGQGLSAKDVETILQRNARRIIPAA